MQQALYCYLDTLSSWSNRARTLALFAVSILLFLSTLTLALAQPTPTINYQAKLSDNTGAAVVNGDYNIRFWLLQNTGQATADAIWSEELTGADQVSVQNGLFSVMLGAVDPLTNVDFNQPLFLAVEIGGTGAPSWDGEMSPRKPLGTVPAAFVAQEANNANTLGGVASSSLLRSDVDDTAAGLLTFSGGLISNGSSTITNLSTNIATTTTLVINNQAFTNLVGAGLTNTSGVLTVDTSALTGSFATTTDFDTETELESLLTDVTNVFTDNDTIGLANGGTGSTDAAGARTNLGLAIGTNVQAFSANLTTFAGITPSANTQSLLAAANYVAMRGLLDLEAGTDFYSITAANTTFEAELNNEAGLYAALSDVSQFWEAGDTLSAGAISAGFGNIDIGTSNLDAGAGDFSGNLDANAGLDVTGNITVTGLVDGRDIVTDGTKLDGIETAATADQTAAEILAALLTVDGPSSNLNADLLDGITSAAFALDTDVDDLSGVTNAAGARTNLGATALGANLFTLTNPNTESFTRINADNTVSTLDAAAFRTAIGAGSGVSFGLDNQLAFMNAAGDDFEYSSGLTFGVGPDVLVGGFDVSTSVFVDSFSVSGQETIPTGLAFSSDGLKMFVVGNTGDDVNEYVLGTAFDVSTSVFVDSFSVSGQETIPTDLAFSPNGLKMFVVGDIGDDVNEYTLSTAFDVSTSVFVDSFSVAGQETGPRGLAFSTDGLKMFVVGQSGRDVNEYTLGTAFDVSTSVFVDSFSVSGQETIPTDLAFSPNGLKMFVVGRSGDDVNEYTLGTAFDVSTSVFVDSFSVAGQETNPVGLAFSTDGLKMFVVGTSGNDVNEYTLGTPTPGNTRLTIDADLNLTGALFDSTDSAGTDGMVLQTTGSGTRWVEDVSPLSLGLDNQLAFMNAAGDDFEYSSGLTFGVGPDVVVDTFDVSTSVFVDSFSVVGQEAIPRGLAFSPNGLKMFVVGNSGNDINEYTLGTAFDVSTSVFVDSFSVSGQETIPTDLAFSPNGLKMFVVGDIGDDVNEYTLSTAFDVSTSVFVDSFSIAGQEAIPQGLAFSTDGRKMFVLGDIGDDVNEYTLGTAFDVSTSVFVDSFSVSGQDTSPFGLAFSSDGLKMFVVGQSGQDVNEYTLGTAFDVSTSVFVDSFSVSGQETIPTDLAFSPNGLKMFVVGRSGDDVNEYTLGTPTPGNTRLTIDADLELSGLFFDSLGSSGSVGDVLQRGAAGLTWVATSTLLANTNDADVLARTFTSTSTWNAVSGLAPNSTVGVQIDASDLTAGQLQVLVDGVVAHTISAGETFDSLVQANSTVSVEAKEIGFDVSTSVFVDSFDVSGQEALPSDLAFSPNGRKMFVLGDIGDDVNEYTLGTAFDVSTSVFVDSFSVAGQEAGPTDLAFSPNGLKMFVLGLAGDDVNEYTLGTAFDVSTSVFVDSFDVSGQEAIPQGLAFSPNGLKMFVLGNSGDDVNEYTLSTAFDVSTSVFVDSFDVSGQEIIPTGLAFSTDGLKMFVVGQFGQDVNEYTLGTAFDVSTSVFVDSFDVSGQETFPVGLAFSSDGLKMFVSGFSGQDVNEYTLTGPFTGTASAVILVGDEGSGGGADLAELYPVTDTNIESGDIVAFIDNSTFALTYATSGTPFALAGIVSTQPGITLSDNSEGPDAVPLALTGRVPTKVNLEGGVIMPGDRITPSSVPGVGRKATLFEPSVGTALTAYNPENPAEQQLVTVFVGLQEGVNVTNLTETLFAGASTTFMTQLTTTMSTTTGTTTQTVEITENIAVSIWNRLADLAGRFVDGILTLTGLRTEEICLTDAEGETCIDRSGLDALLGTVVSPEEDPVENPESGIASEPDQNTDVDSDAPTGGIDTSTSTEPTASTTEPVVPTDTEPEITDTATSSSPVTPGVSTTTATSTTTESVPEDDESVDLVDYTDTTTVESPDLGSTTSTGTTTETTNSDVPDEPTTSPAEITSEPIETGSTNTMTDSQ